ncbi:unnamed protein product [Rotaria sp. Silwood1]|nr:unnamed protein product [Rotaria sp. Silwood1]
MAAAYRVLGDFNMSIKYYEKDIERCRKNIEDPNMFETQLEKIEEAKYKYEQQNTLFIWSKIFHSLVNQIRNTTNFEDSNILELANSFFQCAQLYEESSSYLESIVDYISAFGLYASKSLTEIQVLIYDMINKINSFIECRLKISEILEVCQPVLPSHDFIRIQLNIAAMYRDNNIDDVEDVDGDSDTSNESRMIAFNLYKKLLETNDGDVLTKGVCYYNILCLYKNFIYEDEVGENIIKGMFTMLPKFTKYDCRLLISLARHFLHEYDTNRDRCDMKINRELQKFAKDGFAEKEIKNDEPCIGHLLIECNDLNSAKDYWSSIAEQLESDISSHVLANVNDSDSTFDQILHTIKQPEESTSLLLNQLTNIYETTGDYLMLYATNDQTKDTKLCLDAHNMFKNALNLLKRTQSDKNMIMRVQTKLEKTESLAKSATKSA